MTMCGKETVMLHLELAKELEDTNKVEAAKEYLLAAQALMDSVTKGDQEQVEMMANKLYDKAMLLQQPQQASPKFQSQSNEHAIQVQQQTTITQTKTQHYSKKKGITFADIGGLEELKNEINFKIIEPFRNPDLFTYYGKKAGGGILMYGPPGCGKTLIAKATANEADAQFLHIKASTLKSKYVGETEKNIDELFAKAREEPTIIFFDEFESLGQDRTNSMPHEKNFVAQLLTEIDGIESKDQQLLILAATNEPWSIDPALRREGRFGSTLFIPPPDQESRKSILELHLKNKPTKDINYDYLAEITEGYSGADLKSLCEKAIDSVLQESITTKNRRQITTDDLLRAKVKTKSVLKEWFKKARDQVKMRGLEESFPELFEYKLAKKTIAQVSA